MISSYYSSYSLEYYEVGTVYSFYVRKGEKYAVAADENLIEKYADKLAKVEEDKESYPSVGRFSNLVRTCGVVVEKIMGAGNLDKIRFMIKLVDENGNIQYGTKLYVVNYRGVSTDGWEAMPVQTTLVDGQFCAGNEAKTKPVRKSGTKGAVTLDEVRETGRVTLDEEVQGKTNKVEVKADKAGRKKVSGVTVDDRAGVTLDED